MVQVGIPEKVEWAIRGYKTRHAFDRYNIVTDKDLANAVSALTQRLSTDQRRRQWDPAEAVRIRATSSPSRSLQVVADI